MRRGDEAGDEDRLRDASHRGSGVQDVRLRLGNCQLFARHRVGQGQDREEALAIKNTNIVRELNLPACNPARCNKIFLGPTSRKAGSGLGMTGLAALKGSATSFL